MPWLVPVARPAVAVTPHALPVDVDRGVRDRGAQALRDRHRHPLVAQAVAHDREDVTAEAAEHVAPAAFGGQPLADLLEKPVSRRRAVGVVDEPEAVEPEADRADRPEPGVRGRLQELIGVRAQQSAVRQARQAIMQAALGERLAQLEVGRDRGGEVGEDPDLLLAPVTRRTVDRTERAHRVPVGEHERHARIRDHTEVADREVVGDEWVLSRIGDDERLLRRNRVLTERMAQRRLTHVREMDRQPGLTLDELTIGVDQRDERDRNPQQVGRKARVAVEVLLRLRVEQVEPAQRGDARTVEHRVDR